MIHISYISNNFYKLTKCMLHICRYKLSKFCCAYHLPSLGFPAHGLEDGDEGGAPEHHPWIADVHLCLLRDQMLDLSRFAVLSLPELSGHKVTDF